jgi:hypothetical protein
MGRGAHTEARDVVGLHYDTVQAQVRFFVTEEEGPEGAILNFWREGTSFSMQVGRKGIEAIRDAANDALAALDA